MTMTTAADDDNDDNDIIIITIIRVSGRPLPPAKKKKKIRRRRTQEAATAGRLYGMRPPRKPARRTYLHSRRPHIKSDRCRSAGLGARRPPPVTRACGGADRRRRCRGGGGGRRRGPVEFCPPVCRHALRLTPATSSCSPDATVTPSRRLYSCSSSRTCVVCPPLLSQHR